jgi:hypothetical protein
VIASSGIKNRRFGRFALRRNCVGGVRRGVLVNDLSCVFICSSGSFV